ncbi:MAG: hypothetical protein V1887_04600 [Candidatus Aenigmatarchaeota archaeon]
MKSDAMSLLLSSLVGIVAGYVSFVLVSPEIAVVLAVIVAAGLNFAAGKLAKDVPPEKKGLKWWLTNGGLCYFLLWFVAWVLALNLIK